MVFFFKQKTAYDMRISDWSSDVCSSDLDAASKQPRQRETRKRRRISAKAPCIERAQREGRSSRMTERGTSGSTSNPPAGANVTAGAMTVDVASGRASCRERASQYV